MSLQFEWDTAKARSNSRKHGVTFDEALTVFADPFGRIFDDPDHSVEEQREIIVGHSVKQRLLLVCFTEREGNIRIISARQAGRSERQDYEQKAE